MRLKSHITDNLVTLHDQNVECLTIVYNYKTILFVQLCLFLTAYFHSLFRGYIMKTILLILISKRKNAAVQVQKVLTGLGCMIKTRLGIHDGVMENCTDEGLLILELAGERKKMDELAWKVSLIKGVSSKLVDLSIFTEPKKRTVKKTVKKEFISFRVDKL